MRMSEIFKKLGFKFELAVLLAMFLSSVYGARASTPAPVFVTKSTLYWVQNAVRSANCVIRNEDFLKEVETYPKFTHTTKQAREASRVLREHSQITVRTYKTPNPFSKTTAYVVPSRPFETYVNTRKASRPQKLWVNTLIHEALHPEFGHGDNSSAGKSESAPYRVGSIAEKYAGACK